jgi:predicted DNA-binding protein (UPF0251 family)/DNA-directed RNA polymerase subunit RPC12/RpoP
MARPKRKRIINKPPVMEGFKPFGIPMGKLEPVILLYEEYESIRLADYMGLTHLEAALKMKVSRATFTRIYQSARQNIAEAFIEGKAIFIEGGTYATDDNWYRCDSCKELIISIEESVKCEYCDSNKLRKLNKTI